METSRLTQPEGTDKIGPYAFESRCRTCVLHDYCPVGHEGNRQNMIAAIRDRYGAVLAGIANRFGFGSYPAKLAIDIADDNVRMAHSIDLVQHKASTTLEHPKEKATVELGITRDRSGDEIISATCKRKRFREALGAAVWKIQRD